MQFLYRTSATRPGMLTKGPTPEESARVEAHFVYLQGLAERGTVILVGRTQTADEHTFGICIFNAETDEDARAIMAGDPAVSGGVMCAELFPYKIAIMRAENA